MQAQYVQRLRIRFGKTGPARFIGHLDLARTLERSLARARVPLAYTQGFNRRPKMQLAAALPLGFTSEFELADIWLTERLAPGHVQERLAGKMAPGIPIYELAEVELRSPALQNVTHSAVYVAAVGEQKERQPLLGRIEELLALKELIWSRRNKEYDLRPLILGLTLDEAAENGERIRMRLCLQPGKTGRPDQVLEALGLEPLDALIHRTEIILLREAP